MNWPATIGVLFSSLMCGAVAFAALHSPYWHGPHTEGQKWFDAGVFFALSLVFGAAGFGMTKDIQTAARRKGEDDSG